MKLGKLITYAIAFIFFLGATVYGIIRMIYDGISGDDMARGFMFCSMGFIATTGLIILYSIGAMLENLKVLNEKMIALIMSHNSKGSGGVQNPLFDLLSQLKQNMGDDNSIELDDDDLPPSGSITIAKVGEDGSITPIERREFNNPEELDAIRRELLNKAFKGKDKKLEDMTIAELEEEREKAVDAQEFELATAIRDLISKKQNSAQ